MAIHQRVRDSAFDADTVSIMVDAYECVRHELALPSGHSEETHRIADLVLAMIENGERDASTMCKRVLLMMRSGL
jgi:hypothetical protein